MGLKAGIIGLPNVGKSTLFNAITKKNILAANYPFATIDPNVGVVIVPDKRLEFLENLYNPKSLVPTAYEFIDIAGLVKGASNGEGLGNKFLSHIREVDALVEVVRCFDDENIIHVEGNTNPIRDIEIINTELMITDLEVIELRLNKVGKKTQANGDKNAIVEAELLKRLKKHLEGNNPLRTLDLNEEEKKIIKNFSFLTYKPIIYMANVCEDDLLLEDNEYVKKVKGYALKEKSKTVVVSAKIESELVELNEEDKEMFLTELGIKESGLNKLIEATYDLLGLATYFTAGSDECRAWTFKKGMKAPECAGIIHTDFERGFIRAEVIGFEDLKQNGTELKVKEAGKLRVEGKEYFMKDGDICNFRFNV